MQLPAVQNLQQPIQSFLAQKRQQDSIGQGKSTAPMHCAPRTFYIMWWDMLPVPNDLGSVMD